MNQANKHAADLAAAVNRRAEALSVPEDRPEIDPAFVRSCRDTNERGDGVLYATVNAGRFLWKVHFAGSGEWLVWRGNVWEPDLRGEAFGAVEQVALLYQEQADQVAGEIKALDIQPKQEGAWRFKLKEKLEKGAERLRGVTGAERCLKWAPVVDHRMVVVEHQLDQQPMLLPVQNGVIDLSTGALTRGRPEDLLSKALDLDYDPRADYTPWADFVLEICGGRQDLAAFLKRSFGYAITGHALEQYIWVFVGPGRNGKGVLFGLIAEVMGSYYRELSRGMLIEQRNEPSPSAASEHLYSLLGRRIVVGAETNRGQRIDTGAVKMLTGEDKVTCRPLFKSEISFAPTHTLFLHTNHIPQGLTSDFAMLQRILRVDFPNMYVDDPEAEARRYPLQADKFRKKDPGLKERLRQYRQGILRWLVEGCLEWQRDGIAPPTIVSEWVGELAREEDYISEFIRDCLVESDIGGTRISCADMYGAMRWWWSVNRDPKLKRIPALKTVTTELRNRGYKVEKTGGRYWCEGLHLGYEIASEVSDFLGSPAGKSC